MNNQLYKDVSKLTVYPDDTIKQMIDKYNDGDEGQLTKIVESYLKLIIFYAKQFEKHIRTSEVIDIDDLIAEGVFAVKDAVVKFNPEFNVKFSYYLSIWVKKQMSEFIINNRNTIKIPIGKVVSNNKISKEIEALFQETQNEISRFDIENLNKYSASQIDCYFNQMELVNVDNVFNLKQDDVNDFDEQDELKRKIKYALKYLTPKQRTVIKMLFGIDQPAKTSKEIGEILKITKQSIFQLKEKGLRNIKLVLDNKNKNE